MGDDWCWFAPIDAPADDAIAQARAFDEHDGAYGWLAVWPSGRKPRRNAVRMDGRLVDPHGETAWVSLVMLDRGREPLFDDPAVSGALRAVLAGPPPDAVSTFVRDSTHFSGGVTVRRTGRSALRDDPFARLGPHEVLRVDAGLFGKVPPPAGPVIQRYSGQPWPMAGF